jgi:hypothetical protein
MGLLRRSGRLNRADKGTDQRWEPTRESCALGLEQGGNKEIVPL